MNAAPSRLDLQVPAPGDLMLHPATVLAVATLLLNDHVLKGTAPGWFTGKLSDVAGLVFFPLLLVSAGELSLRERWQASWSRTRSVGVAVVITGLAFSVVKTWPPAAEAYRVVLAAATWPLRALLSGFEPVALGRAHLTEDATDLFCLTALAVPLATAWLRQRRQA